jgi:hypothetical protein
LQFERCSVTPCATDDEFNEWIKPVDINEIIISSFFDVSDYDSPIHYYLDTFYASFFEGRSTYY